MTVMWYRGMSSILFSCLMYKRQRDITLLVTIKNTLNMLNNVSASTQNCRKGKFTSDAKNLHTLCNTMTMFV